MAPTNSPPLQPLCKKSPPPILRQTRMRSRMPGAAPLMKGLDDKGLPRETLPRDPEDLPFDQAIRMATRPKIILRSRQAVAPKEVTRRSKIVLRVSKSKAKAKSETSKAASGCQYSSHSEVAEILSNLYHSAARPSSEGSTAAETETKVSRRDLLRARLPRLYTDF